MWMQTGLIQRIVVSTVLTALMSFSSIFMNFEIAALGLSLVIYGTQFQNNTFLMVAYEMSRDIVSENSRQIRSINYNA